MKLLIIFSFSILSASLFAQNVGVNGDGSSPDASAILDVKATDKGVLVPRVDIVDLATAAPVTIPATSLLVYNTNTTTGPGFFYWDGTAWVSVGGVKEINDLTDGKTDYATLYSVYLGENAGAATTGGGVGPWNGKYNVVMGVDAFKTTTTGHTSVAIGYKALELGVHSTRNVAVGYLALNLNGNSGNTAIGSNSMEKAIGSDNTALGNFSLNELQVGESNVAIGHSSGGQLATGNDNVLLGYSSGNNITSGHHNIAIGSGVRLQNGTSSNQMNIGNLIYADSLYSSTGRIGVGYGNNSPDASAVLDVKSTTAGLLIPRMTLVQRNAIVLPSTSLLIYQTTNTTGFYYNVGTPATPFWQLMAIDDGSTPVTSIDGLSDGKAFANNVFLGLNAGNAAVAGASDNSALGKDAMNGLTTGINNIAIGAGAMSSTTTGSDNILIGKWTQGLTSASASNELSIGQAIFGTGIYTVNSKIGIGYLNHSPNSTLDVSGSVAYSLRDGGLTVLGEDDYVYTMSDFSGGGIVVLPIASGIKGRVYIIKLTIAGSCTVATQGSETIDGAVNYLLSAQWKFVKVQSDGSNWIIIGQN